jgi:hypothetical protein
MEWDGKGYQVHAVTSTADKTYITDIIESDEFGKLDGLMHIMNWHEFN